MRAQAEHLGKAGKYKGILKITLSVHSVIQYLALVECLISIC